MVAVRQEKLGQRRFELRPLRWLNFHHLAQNKFGEYLNLDFFKQTQSINILLTNYPLKNRLQIPSYRIMLCDLISGYLHIVLCAICTTMSYRKAHLPRWIKKVG